MSNERKKEILSLIKEHGEIRLNQLRELFPQVSEMTLRRDLIFLEENGWVLRTHGGARIAESDDNPNEFDFSERVASNIHPKVLIAQHALKMLDQHSSIYLDAGTTMTAFAEAMPDTGLYVITNAPNIGIEVMKRKNMEVILLGGSLNKTTISITGPFALNELEHMNIDTAFIATGGFSLDSGFTNPYIGECELKRKVIKIAKRVIVMFDSSKVNRSLPFTFATLDDIDVIITDRPLPSEILEQAKEKGVEVITSE